MADKEEDYLFELSCLQKRSARKRFRQDIFDAWGHRCAYCGSDRGSTLDHIVAKAKGGPTKRGNMVACCASCNLLKSSEDWYRWFRVQSFWTLEREIRIFEWLSDNHDASIAAREYEKRFRLPPPLPFGEEVPGAEI